MIDFLWNEAKGRGGEGRWVKPCSYSQEGFPSRGTGLLGTSAHRKAPKIPVDTAPPSLVAQRELAEAALSRAAAPQQHHPWLMCSR